MNYQTVPLFLYSRGTNVNKWHKPLVRLAINCHINYWNCLWLPISLNESLKKDHNIIIIWSWCSTIHASTGLRAAWARQWGVCRGPTFVAKYNPFKDTPAITISQLWQLIVPIISIAKSSSSNLQWMFVLSWINCPLRILRRKKTKWNLIMPGRWKLWLSKYSDSRWKPCSLPYVESFDWLRLRVFEKTESESHKMYQKLISLHVDNWVVVGSRDWFVPNSD